MIFATMGSTTSCVVMMVTLIDSNTNHMAMIPSTNHMAMTTMVMDSTNNCVAMITVVMGFCNGATMGPSSAINRFLIFLKLLPKSIFQFVQESFIIFQNL